MKTTLMFAPMEGITFARFRELHYSMFPGTDEYYTPFIAPDSRGSFRAKYLKELTADSAVPTIPQLLVNNAEAFNLTADKLQDLGFSEINLNAGCPSGTVFSKHKGAGMLADPAGLDRTLESIFDHAARRGYRVSIKTRMGVHSTEEFPAILEVYNRYPLSRLIVHARCRDAFYQGEADLKGFLSAAAGSRCPVVYNGNIFSPEDLQHVQELAPETDAFMLGRGAVSNPAIFRQLRGGEPLRRSELKEFHDRLTGIWLSGGLAPRFTVERMKTLWVYWQVNFPEEQKQIRAILKARDMQAYRGAVAAVF